MRIFRALFLATLGLILLLSITPHPNSPYTLHPTSLQKEALFVEQVAYMGEELLGAYSDKYRHILAFLLLGALFDLSYFISAWKKGVLLLLYGVLIEAVQIFLPYREGDLFDIIINASAIFFYFFLTRVVVRDIFLRWYANYRRRVSG